MFIEIQAELLGLILAMLSHVMVNITGLEGRSKSRILIHECMVFGTISTDYRMKASKSNTKTNTKIKKNKGLTNDSYYVIYF